MWVVNNEQVSALTSHRTANTDSEVVPTLTGVPPTRCLRVRLENQIRKNLVVNLRIYEISHLSTKTHRKLGSVAGLDDFLTGILA